MHGLTRPSTEQEKSLGLHHETTTCEPVKTRRTHTSQKEARRQRMAIMLLMCTGPPPTHIGWQNRAYQ